MPAITVSRKLGSLGSQIARNLAEHLGYRMVWREVINEAACRACAPDVALAMIDDLGLLGLRPSAKARRAYHHNVQQVVAELAAEGDVVIVGRAGQVILRNEPDVLHIRIIAPETIRVERLATRHSISPAAALAQIRKSDAHRRTYLRRNYNVDWDNPGLYDLVINTKHITASLATMLIANIWRLKTGHKHPAKPSQ